MDIGKENYPDVIRVSLSSKSYIYLSNMVRIYFEAMRSILYQREIHKLIKKDTSEYLIQLSNVNYDMAIISWCKLFGSKRSQKTHYQHLMKQSDLIGCLKTIGITNDTELKDSLFKHLGLEDEQFDEYLKNSIGRYRDQFVAHFDLELHEKKYDDPDNNEIDNKLLKSHPKFDVAIQSLDWLYNLISKLLHCKQDKINGRGWAVFTPEKNKRRILKEIKLLIERLA